MPEGPEIIISTQYLKSKLQNKSIKSIKILGGRYSHQELIGLKLLRPSRSYKIIDINSKGKFIWFELQDTKDRTTIYLANTLGMAGNWSFYKSKSSRIRFQICCTKKKKKRYYNLYFADSRNFGDIRFYDNVEDLESRLDKLAPDILKGGLSDREIVNLIDKYIKKSRADKNVVKTLMNQNAVVSGIGNYLVAEILYDAKINPHRSLDDFSKAEKKRLAHSIRKITKQSYYDNKTGYMVNYTEFMENHPVKVDKRIFPNYHPDIKVDKTFEFKVYQKKKDPKGNKVKRDSIVKNRTIHWVPNIQK